MQYNNKKRDTQHNCIQHKGITIMTLDTFMQSVTNTPVMLCRYAVCRYAECRGAVKLSEIDPRLIDMRDVPCQLHQTTFYGGQCCKTFYGCNLRLFVMTIRIVKKRKEEKGTLIKLATSLILLGKNM
jgi:hypothetical protein